MADVLSRWSTLLQQTALSELDRRAVGATESARSLAMERAPTIHSDHDALHAWGMLGRLLADADASPTLAARMLDTLVEAEGGAPTWISLARATLFEAYVATRREAIELATADRWRFPRCVVRIDDSTAAVAASFPNDDPDATARWADEIASGLAKWGVRRVYVDGETTNKAALADALGVAGIELARPRR
jgi:hypothetical protein